VDASRTARLRELWQQETATSDRLRTVIDDVSLNAIASGLLVELSLAIAKPLSLGALCSLIPGKGLLPVAFTLLSKFAERLCCNMPDSR
jgi:hypothetical protein